jgi:hypothetical protein
MLGFVPVAVTVAADATCGEIIESVEITKTRDKRLIRHRRTFGALSIEITDKLETINAKDKN